MVKNKTRWVIPLLILIGCIAATLGPYYYFFEAQAISNSSNDWGVFGDYVGGVLGVLISGVAVFLIWNTYTLQKEELKKTSESLDFQNTTQTFFKLIERKDSIISDTAFRKEKGLVFYQTYADRAKKDFDLRKGLKRDIERIKQTIEHTLDYHARLSIKRYINIVHAICVLINPDEYEELSETQTSNLNSLSKIFSNYLTDEEKSILAYYLWWDKFNRTKNFLIENGTIPNVYDLHEIDDSL
jgi:hypothetical protein